MKGKKLFLYSLTSLAVIASSAVSAQETATAPTLEGGWSGMIGGLLFVPSNDLQGYAATTSAGSGNVNTNFLNNEGEYKLGWQAAIGYIFDNTANGIELSFRDYNGSSSSDTVNNPDDLYDVEDYDLLTASGNAKSRLQNWDLMVSQFLDVGNSVQMRFLGGISYVSKLDQSNTLNYDYTSFAGGQQSYDEYENNVAEISSQFSGLGPRVGIDARYDFGQGFGIVGGASLAYFLGSLDSDINQTSTFTVTDDGELIFKDVNTFSQQSSLDNHSVTNLRANLGVDYVYFFEDQDLPTLGLELGYEVDTYINAVGVASGASSAGGNTFPLTETSNLTFSGPYLNLKGVF